MTVCRCHAKQMSLLRNIFSRNQLLVDTIRCWCIAKNAVITIEVRRLVRIFGESSICKPLYFIDAIIRSDSKGNGSLMLLTRKYAAIVIYCRYISQMEFVSIPFILLMKNDWETIIREIVLWTLLSHKARKNMWLFLV